MILLCRKPTHPGEMLREEFLPDYGLTVAQFAQRLAVSRQTANELVHERRSVTPQMALRLGMLFGTTPQYWLNLQHNIDLWHELDLNKDMFVDVIPLEVPQVALG